jgi:16S rRNA (guanine527-N7)-methyltransferase
MNLTRISRPEDLVRLHVVDSLVPWRYAQPVAPLVDIGSGAGYPGIPTAIVHGGPVLLCESVGKKASFLKECVAQLGIEVDVYQGRAEELALERGAAFHTVTARAVSALPSLVELAAPLLQPGGRLIALKGSPAPSEIAAGAAAARMCGLTPVGRWEYTLPDGDDRRCVIAYERTGEAEIRLPRRTGLAQRQPLGG